MSSYCHNQVGIFSWSDYSHHYKNILNALKSDDSGSYYDYGKGLQFRGEDFESLFINHSCEPDVGGAYN